MPVTVKLSNEFYERLGDNVANELVDWFNQVDTSYRVEFKDLFEVHFSRFEAKLEQRVAELRAEIGAARTDLGARLDQRMAEADAKWEKRMAEADAGWGKRAAETDARAKKTMCRCVCSAR